MMRVAPWQPLLHTRKLLQRFLGDGQRLHQHCDVAQLARDHAEVALLFHHELRHVAVLLFDAALGVVAGVAIILTALAAGYATWMRARTANGHHDQIAGLHFRDLWPGLDHFAQRLVPDHQVFETLGRSAVLKRDDLAVGSANAHVQNPHFGLGWRHNDRLRMIDNLDFAFGRKNRDGKHRISEYRIQETFLLTSRLD